MTVLWWLDEAAHLFASTTFSRLGKTKSKNKTTTPLLKSQRSLWSEREADPPLRELLVKRKSPTLLSLYN